jgi:hypothetical protein
MSFDVINATSAKSLHKSLYFCTSGLLLKFVTQIVITTLNDDIFSFQVLPLLVKNIFGWQLFHTFYQCENNKGMPAYDSSKFKQSSSAFHITFIVIKVNTILYFFCEVIINSYTINNFISRNCTFAFQ